MIVTVPVLVVSPAANESVVFVLRVMSFATASLCPLVSSKGANGGTGIAETDSVTGTNEALLSTAVTVATPAFSLIVI